MTLGSLQGAIRQAETLASDQKWSEAVDVLMQGVRRFGNDVELLFALSRCYFALEKFAQSRQFVLRVLENSPNHIRGIVQLGWTALAEADFELARSQFERAIELGAEDWKLHCHLAMLKVRDAELDGAEDHLTRAIELGCPDTTAVANLAYVLMLGGQVDESITLIAPTLGAFPKDIYTLQTSATVLNYSQQPTPHEVFDLHRRFGEAIQASVKRLGPAADISAAPEKRLRIGYLSADFRSHSVAHFVLPIIEQHDRKQVEVFLYSVAHREDDVSQRFRDATDQWRACSKMKDDQLAQQIRDDRIDILVELGGLFDNHRLAVMARRVAPVQVTYCGYPNTTGIREIDYRIVDAITDPDGAGLFATEKLWRLDRCFLGYRTLKPVDPPRRHPREKDKAVVFGSFNNLAKNAPHTLDAWSEILKRVPESRLLLKSSSLHEERVKQRLLAEFAARGIDADRLILKAYVESAEEHLALYEQMDVALDTFPYHGTTTTCEALSMGVPVVSLYGDRHAARVGGSLLQAAGHPEWVATSWQQYIDIACDLAADGQRLRQIQQALPAELQASALCDTQAFVRELEAAYRQMWYGWCEEQQDALS